MRLKNAIAYMLGISALCTTVLAHTAKPLNNTLSTKTSLSSVPFAKQDKRIYQPTTGKPLAFSKCYVEDKALGLAPKKDISKSPFSKVQDTPPGVMIGNTFYDLQSNGSMPHRISVFEDGSDKSAQVVWMAATDEDGFGNPPHPTRGSYYAILDIKDPISPKKYTDVPWERMESVRSGFPSIVQFKDGSVGSIGHVISSGSSASALRLTKNTSFGDTKFTTKQIPGSDSSLWAHSTVDGADIIHVAFTSDTSSKNFSNQVIYMRSTDKGTTWSEPKYMTGPNSDPQLPTGRGANSYQFAVRGNTVALGYQDTNFNLIIVKSSDNGATWNQAKLIFGGAAHQNAYMVEDFGDGTFSAVTDTVPICGPAFDLIVDADDNVHAVAATSPSWKSGIAKMNDAGQIEFLADTVYSNLYTRVTGIYYSEAANQTSFLTSEETWDGQGRVVTRSFGNGNHRYHKLAYDEAENALYVAWTGIKNGDYAETIFADNTSDFGLFGHILLSKKSASSETWEPEINLTPDANDCQFSSVYKDAKDGIVMLAYQSDLTPGIRVQNTNQSIEDNQIYFYGFKPTFVGIHDAELQVADFSMSPNPATDQVVLNFGQNINKASVQITNALGVKVAELPQELAQSGSVVLSTVSFPSGTYFCTLISGNASITKMLNIVK